jgi:dTDP-4-amino-4,6-dideoxygalactose transaminase
MASGASELALSGGTPAHQGDWPSWPVHDEREREALLAVLESGQWWHGERVREFEEAFAAFQDAAFGVTCTSGSAALELALLACGVGTGDEVIVPPYTFIATATAVLKVNAIPVFVDIEPDTLNLDPSQIEAAVTPQTTAILPVHFAGRPADMDAINAIAKKHRLRVIEDAAHAWGSKLDGKGCGALGQCGTFSFQMSKNITAGEGGIVLTNDEALARNVRALSNVGRGAEPGDRAHGLPCGNLRMTEFQAAVLLAQLGRLEEQTTRRQANAAILDAGLAQVEGIAPLRPDPRANPRSYHLYIFRFDAEAFGCSRERFIEALQAEGVPCHGGYPEPIYRQHLFQQSADELPRPCPYYGMLTNYHEVRCPNAERACREVVWLKHPLLIAGEEDMRAILAAVEKIRAHAVELGE